MGSVELFDNSDFCFQASLTLVKFFALALSVCRQVCNTYFEHPPEFLRSDYFLFSSSNVNFGVHYW